uniref:eIF-4F 25 kDa subunit n=1 Tax=Hirondellea gigas TaxID=1518452 RepID=A0A2P2HVZ9_9CRUS
MSAAVVVNGEKPVEKLDGEEEQNETDEMYKALDTAKTAPKVSIEQSLKHPLNSRWCLWYFINDKNLAWEDSQIKVASYGTVEDFWALFNHIESASKLRVGCDYSLFKQGIKPMWEDSANINGGRWSISVPKNQRFTELDDLWMEMIMMMVGENEEECVNQDICGAVVAVRPRNGRLALWTANGRNAELALKVGCCLKNTLSIPPNHSIEFNLHSDTSVKRSSTVRALYTV